MSASWLERLEDKPEGQSVQNGRETINVIWIGHARNDKERGERHGDSRTENVKIRLGGFHFPEKIEYGISTSEERRM